MTGDRQTAVIVVAVGVVVMNEGDVLLIQRRNPPQQGAWTLPGGRQQFGETLRETAVREVREETGVAISLHGLIDTIDLIERDAAGQVTRHYVVADFWGEAAPAEPVAADDALDSRWVAFTDLGRYHLTQEVCRMIEEARRLRVRRPSPARVAS